MKIVTYIVGMLALISGTVWGWQTLVLNLPLEAPAISTPVHATARTQAQIESAMNTAMTFVPPARIADRALTPIYPATPAKQLLGTTPSLPRTVVARVNARNAARSFAKASPHETNAIKTHIASARPAAAQRVAANAPMQIHPPRWSDSIVTASNRDDDTPRLGYAEERQPRFFALFN